MDLRVKGLHRVISLFTTLVLVSACGGQQQAPAQPKPAVQVIAAERSEVTSAAEFVGRVTSSEDVVISPQVSGQVMRRHFEEGQDVEEGALLFELDPATYESEVSRLRASKEQVDSALEIAQIRYNRGDKLHEQSLISDMDMDELTSNRVQAKAAVSQAQAELDKALLNLEYTKIYAPISGRISRASVAIGDLVSSSSQMATLVKLEPMWVNFQASDKEILRTRERMQGDGSRQIETKDLIVKLILPNGQEYSQTGVLSAADNRIDAATGTLSVTAVFANPTQKLLPGMYATVKISSPIPRKALLIEQRAVQQDQQGYFVMLVNAENKVEKRIVELGNKYDVRWQVESGLQEGDKVIVVGLQKVRPGAEVTSEPAVPLGIAKTE